jgi:hypothetical protein
MLTGCQRHQLIAEPYKHNPPLTTQSLFTTNPWLPYKIIRDSVVGGLRSMYTLAQLRRHLVGFDQDTLFAVRPLPVLAVAGERERERRCCGR